MKITKLIQELELAIQNGMEDVEFVSSYYQVMQKPYLSQGFDSSGNPTKLLLIEV